MGRRRSFDEDKVLENVMRAFWARGFEATSVQDLVDATGLERGSLYNAFGDKDHLFQAGFKRYDQPRRARMQPTNDPVANLRSFFDHLITSACADKSLKGCMLINSTLELNQLSAASREQVLNALNEAEQFFKTTILAAQEGGQIGQNVDAARVAHVMLGAVVSIRLLSRAKATPQTFINLAENALAAANIRRQTSP